MDRLILVIALMMSCIPCSWAQISESQNDSLPKVLSFEYEDRCGNPLTSSDLWQSFNGTVIKILSGDTIVVLAQGNKRKNVKLAAIDVTVSDNDARLLLTDLILNQRVEVLVNPSNINSKNLSGIVYSSKYKEINRELIKAGAAKYKKPLAYSMSSYLACVYRIIENETREAKRGLWKDID